MTDDTLPRFHASRLGKNTIPLPRDEAVTFAQLHGAAKERNGSESMEVASQPLMHG